MSVELKYYSNNRPVNQFELNFIRYNLPDDYELIYRRVNHRCEDKVYLVKVDYTRKKIFVEFKE